MHRLSLNQLSLFYLTVSPKFQHSTSFVFANSQKNYSFLSQSSRKVILPTTTRTTSLSSRFANSSNHSQDNVGLADIGTEEKQNQSGEEQEEETITMSSSSPSSDDPPLLLSSWREKIEISIAKSRKIRGGNYVQIATVDPITLEPRCRTVVFRGFLKSQNTKKEEGEKSKTPLPCIMKMITDKRSNKFSEVTNNTHVNNGKMSNTVEMVWWFAKSSEQYRIRGQLEFVGGDETDPNLLIARKEQWGNLSDMAREQFYWVDPGLIFNSDESSKEALSQIPPGGRDEDGKVLPPPENFLLMLLYPKRCDYLRLSDNFRQIDDLNAEDQEWQSNRVNP